MFSKPLNNVLLYLFYFVGPEVSDENSNCYRDSPSERIFDDQHKLDYNTPDECDQLCRDLGFTLYGVEFSNECFCGNDMPPEDLIIEMSQCNLDCAGDSSQKCGGSNAINIGQTNKNSEFTVQLREEKYPEILINEKWSPICGHYFWDNNYGATLFCQKLNSTYHYGSVKNPVKSLESDGIRVGKCTKEDNDLSSCTGACNDFPQIGGQCSNSANGKCGAGQGPTIEIECFKQGL